MLKVLASPAKIVMLGNFRRPVTNVLNHFAMVTIIIYVSCCTFLLPTLSVQLKSLQFPTRFIERNVYILGENISLNSFQRLLC